MSRSRSRSRSRSPESKFSRSLSPPPLPARRFTRGDRVVCNIGDPYGWVAGTVNAVNEPDPQYAGEFLPYVVKLDPPISRLIMVPRDANALCRPEICFDEARHGGTAFALTCAPARAPARARRFAKEDRVAVAVEDQTDSLSDWAAGTVVDVDYVVAEFPEDRGDPTAPSLPPQPPLPYRVALDAGRIVLVHRDEHWLIRDLKLQDPGPRQGKVRALAKFITRRTADGAWEKVDHGTRKVRPCAAPVDD